MAIAVAVSPNFLPEKTSPATAQAAPPAPEVEIAQVETRRMAETAEFLGRIEARETVELRAQVAGALDEVAFRDGALVEEGDLLFRIDPRPYEIALTQAKARVAETQARLAAAQATLGRTSQLVERAIVSREAFDEAQAESETLVAQTEAARAAVLAAELDLSFTEIAAPISGRIGRASLTRGNYVAAGDGSATPLARIASVDPIHVSFDVDEGTYLKFLADRSPLPEAGRGALKVAVGLMGEDGVLHEGTVDFIDNRVDPTTGTVKARAALPNPDGRLAPGFFARVQISLGEPQRTVLVDESAVGTSQDQRFVLVLGEKNTLEYRAVELGQAVGDMRIVTAGLKPGEEIMMKGLARPGMQVVPVPHAVASVGAEERTDR
ncbi:MAG: efflux RND transporter periplasmic adaptor subunit [Aurantimonas endophytica]|uniref:efflux RND transporter periplasmic adaptor subunit n=1 Tax=Aurantimonas endophytica TaxID=1522175 RepID=UPI0030013245